jgi:DNA-binding NarL/FixJ family response regulator
MKKKIRILIADDHPIVREGLVHALNRQSDMCVIAEASNGMEVCQLHDRPLYSIRGYTSQSPGFCHQRRL